jgi:hypothetical protein
MNLNHLSPMNNIRARSVLDEPTPVVGMGATLLVGSDRYGCTIHRIFTYQKGKIVLELTHDKTKLVSGSRMSEDQEYEYIPDPDRKEKFLFMKNEQGIWEQVQYRVFEYGYDEVTEERTIIKQSSRLSKVEGSRSLQIGVRNQYLDPCF